MKAIRNYPPRLPSGPHSLTIAVVPPTGGRGPLAWSLIEGLLSCRALGVSVTDYTFEDCQLALAEGQLRLPADTCLLEFARLVRGLG